MIWLQDAAKALLIVHAFSAILLLGSTTHNFLITVRYPWGRFEKVKLEKLYAKVQFVSWLITFALGSIIYPSYRVYVRGVVLDREYPWASNLFDIKENWAALGLPLIICFFILSRIIQPEKERLLIIPYVGLSALNFVVVWVCAVLGLIVTSVKGIP